MGNQNTKDTYRKLLSQLTKCEKELDYLTGSLNYYSNEVLAEWLKRDVLDSHLGHIRRGEESPYRPCKGNMFCPYNNPNNKGIGYTLEYIVEGCRYSDTNWNVLIHKPTLSKKNYRGVKQSSIGQKIITSWIGSPSSNSSVYGTTSNKIIKIITSWNERMYKEEVYYM